MTRYVAQVAIKLESVPNLRGKWQKGHARNKEYRRCGGLLAAMSRAPLDALPATVTIIRIAPKALDDDNMVAACKAVRDGIADHFGVSDGPKGPITWRYQQAKGPPKTYALEVQIVPAAHARESQNSADS